jgi:4-amino-4-deoxy-L-arabinose transferase-like glycosyltransferase
MSNDVLSPLVVGLALYCTLILYLEDRAVFFHIATGVLAAAAVLVKYTNFYVLPVFLAVLALKWRAAREGRRKLILSLITMALPLGIWLARNVEVLDDITGSKAKAAALGWTLKPLGEMSHHPIFTPAGLYTFLSGYLQTFWRGEMLWYGNEMALKPADLLYAGTSMLFLVAAVLALKRGKKPVGPERAVNIAGMAMIAMGLAFMFVMSIAYDFGNCYNPSREHPYLNQGRLLLGALIPFLGLYLYGMHAFLARIKLEKLRTPLIILMLLVMVSSEVYLTAPVFKSQYNWYAMRDSYLDLDTFVTVQSSDR